MEHKTPGRDPALDEVRAVAMVLVLVVHAAGNCLHLPPGSPDWWGALFWAALARPAVPLFFLCSGALMLCRDVSPRRLLTHNLPRILCAMFAWAFLYRLYTLAAEGGLTPAGVWEAVKHTLLFHHEFHLYYLHILLLVYAFLPAVRVFTRAASRRELEYLLGLWAVTGILFPLLRYFWPFTLVEQIDELYKMNIAYSAVGYALLGHYLRQYGRTVKRQWYALALAGGLALTFGGSAVLSLRDGALSDIFLEGMSPGPMLMALGLFGLLLGRERRSPAWVRVTNRAARASFCIYLCHILYLRLFIRLGLDPCASPCLLTIPAVSLLMLAAGWLTWEVLRHIPIVRTYLI